MSTTTQKLDIRVNKITSGKNAYSRVGAYDTHGLTVTPWSVGINDEELIIVRKNKASFDGVIFHDGGSDGTHAQAVASAKRYLRLVYNKNRGLTH